jgi:two-component system cell cycle sensor histidine kinase/response regulator CckA
MKRAPTILVLDDEESHRMTMTRILRADGYVVIPISRGIDAHWLVERLGSSVDLVVADFAGPEADDYHLGIPIGALLAHALVLFVSARRRDDSIRHGLLHPETPFLQKPFSPGVLTRRVRTLLSRRSLPPAA